MARLTPAWALMSVVCIAHYSRAFFFQPTPTDTPRLEVTPVDPVIASGSSLELNCTMKNPALAGSAQSMYFELVPDHGGESTRLNHSALLDDNTVQLTLHDVTPAQSGFYYCYLDDTLFVDASHVRIMDPPQAVTHINCTSDNFQDMTCVVCDNDDPAVRGTAYDISYKIGSDDAAAWRECGDYILDGCGCYFCAIYSKYDCTPGPASLTFYKFDDYAIRVTARTDIEELPPVETFVYTGYAQVILRPVSSLGAIEVTSNSSSLSWEIHDDLKPYSDLIIYQITYYSEFQPENILVVNSSGNPKYQTRIRHEFDGLEAFTNYNMAVRARMEGSIYWSDITRASLKTKASAACSGPHIVEGAYRQDLCDHSVDRCYNLQFFWVAYNNSCAHGIVEGYIITIDGDAVKTVSPPDVYSALVPLSDVGHHTVCMSALTSDAGDGPRFESAASCISVRSPTQWEPTLDQLYAETVNATSAVSFHYKQPGHEHFAILIVTCTPMEADRTHCQTSPVLHRFTGSPATVTVPHADMGDMHAVALVTSHLSPGQLSDWLVPCDNTERVEPPAFSMDASKDRIALTLTRSPCDGRNHKHHITNYSITASGHGAPQSPQIVDGWDDRYVFRHLKPNKKYQIAVQAISYGKRSPENKQSIRTEESGITEDDVGIYIGVTFAVMLFAVLVFLVMYRVHRFRQHYKEEIDFQFPPEVEKDQQRDSEDVIPNEPIQQGLTIQPHRPINTHPEGNPISGSPDSEDSHLMRSSVSSTSTSSLIESYPNAFELVRDTNASSETSHSKNDIESSNRELSHTINHVYSADTQWSSSDPSNGSYKDTNTCYGFNGTPTSHDEAISDSVLCGYNSSENENTLSGNRVDQKQPSNQTRHNESQGMLFGNIEGRLVIDPRVFAHSLSEDPNIQALKDKSETIALSESINEQPNNGSVENVTSLDLHENVPNETKTDTTTDIEQSSGSFEASRRSSSAPDYLSSPKLDNDLDLDNGIVAGYTAESHATRHTDATVEEDADGSCHNTEIKKPQMLHSDTLGSLRGLEQITNSSANSSCNTGLISTGSIQGYCDASKEEMRFDQVPSSEQEAVDSSVSGYTDSSAGTRHTFGGPIHCIDENEPFGFDQVPPYFQEANITALSSDGRTDESSGDSQQTSGGPIPGYCEADEIDTRFDQIPNEAQGMDENRMSEERDNVEEDNEELNHEYVDQAAQAEGYTIRHTDEIQHQHDLPVLTILPDTSINRFEQSVQ